MAVYEVKFLIQADSRLDAAAAVRVVNAPHTEPGFSIWGYHARINEDTERIYLDTRSGTESILGHPHASGEIPEETRKTWKPRKPRGPMSAEHKAALRAGRQKAREKRLEESQKQSDLP